MSAPAMESTVLVVEDEGDVVDLLRYNLSKAGFSVSVANDGIMGFRLAREIRPDVVILDLMLPQMDGRSVCRALKGDPETEALPILMLTACSEPDQRVQGFEIGADDYVTKPFSPRELVLRVQALHRRLSKRPNASVTVADCFEIDKERYEIRMDGKRLDLTTTEFKLLALLIDRRGRTQSRDGLLFEVWGYRCSMDTRTVDTHIRRLREKLGPHASRLETIRGEGYRFKVVGLS